MFKFRLGAILPLGRRRGSVIALAVASGLAAAPRAEASLVGLYQFDSAQALGRDSSGAGNDLTAYGTAAFTSAGLQGGGLALDGAGYLSTLTGEAPMLFPLHGSSYTLAASFQTTDINNLAGIIGWGAYGSADQVNALRLNNDGNPADTGFRHYWWSNDLDVAANTSDGAWHTVVVNFDGTTRSLYFDGALRGSDTPGTPDVLNASFAIGLTNLSEAFHGTLDNVAVFDAALTPGQVSAAIGSAGVPEPATWALMIGGLGLAGAALRRRRAAVTA